MPCNQQHQSSSTEGKHWTADAYIYVFWLCVTVECLVHTAAKASSWKFKNMMDDTTISRGWREKGNASFRNFTDSNSTERQRNYLESALRSYYRAYETAESSPDKSSAAKNYAMAAWRLTTVLSQLNEVANLCGFRFREAIGYFSKVGPTTFKLKQVGLAQLSLTNPRVALHHH